MFLEYASLTVAEQATYSLYKTNAPFDSGFAFVYDLTDLYLSGGQPNGLWLQQVQLLDGMLSRSYLAQNKILYRATSEDMVIPYVKNNNFIYPGYMSTTNDSTAVHAHFGVRGTPALLIVDCTRGTSALNMDMNPDHGNTWEKEILLPRSLPLTLVDITTVTDSKEIALHMGAYFASIKSSLRLYKFTTSVS